MTCNKIRSCAAGLALLLYTALATAEALDGAEVRFHGRVTDEGPRWTWQVASADQTWAVDTADARTAGDQLVFNLANRGHLLFPQTFPSKNVVQTGLWSSGAAWRS